MDTKPWYKSKLIWANILAVVIAVLSYLGAFPGLIPPEFGPGFLAAIGALNIVLRVLTNQPIAPLLAGKGDSTTQK